MRRRKYLAAIGLAAGAGLAGCSGETGSNNSSESGGNDSEGSGGSGGNESSGNSEETEMMTSSDESDSEDTEMSTSSGDDSGEETESEDSTSTDASSEEDTDSESEGESEDSSNSSEDSDSGSESSGDVSLDEEEIVDGVTLDSSEWYNEDSGLSTGVRGELTAEQDFDFIFVNAQIYDSDGTRVGEGSDSSEGVSSGESITFDCLMVPDDPSVVASYNIEITDSAM